MKALLAYQFLPGNTKFVLDSGATTTMVNSLDFFIQIQMKTEEIELADGSTIHSQGHGTIQLELPHRILQIKDALYMPDLATNLLTPALSPKDLLQLHQEAGHPLIEYFRKMFPETKIPEFKCIT
ncbi:hypothetical protein O181_019519 [Austropuccinia psidii MF-1]|uniref:Retrovirus-related Pol polyprotein from transposon TNT 1-94-like beta-barrel domain-containing protein n=1 Tax=Austropuccinia psidii MF-1 TaxID=1389203 RepID=A0A9Q3C790_9BASI|nr:hypothetical protein [Austropuccinia psidii MF-1]